MKKKIIWVLSILIAIGILVCVYLKINNTQNNIIQEEPTKVESVTIGMITFPGYAPLYLAQEKGFFGDLNVDLVRIEAIGDLRAAMNSKNIDMYAATFDIYQATEGNEPPGIGFMMIDESHGGDGILVSSDINSLKDLKGRTVGAEPGFPPYFILQYMLNKEGMSLDDVDFKDLSTADTSSAFVANQIDVAGVYEPYLSIGAEKREGAKVLISSVETPNIIADLLFTSEELLEQSPETLKIISDGWFKAIAYWKSNPDESMKIMANAFGIDQEEMEDIKSGIGRYTLDDNKKLFDKTRKDNVYDTFKLVGDILENNDSAGIRVKAEDKLTNKIINSYN